MVRERVGDWRLAWRFALAGLLAGALVLILSTSGVMNGPFFAAQDQLFPAPAPDQSVTFIALDQRSLAANGSTPSNADHARVINYLASLHPKVILFDLPLDLSSGDDPELLPNHGLPPVSWGIGINTGPAVVGNMGSKDRLQYTGLGDTVNTAARFCSAAPAFNILVGWPTFEACSEYIAIDEMPSLQLKGKSAEKFRVLRVSAIREHREAQWVPIPTEAALESYEAFKLRYAQQSVFAAAQEAGK